AQELKRVVTASDRAGKGMKEYSVSLGDSIIQNFKFIHAMGLVTGAILAARRAITELIEESRAFYEAMTVLQSTAMNFNEVLDELTVRARTLAQRFGQSIEEVTSIAY